ncbi:MAG: hypothetical protein AAFR97_11555 [Bacteroidota bacterium]
MAQHHVQPPVEYEEAPIEYYEYEPVVNEAIDEEVEFRPFEEDALDDLRDAFDYSAPRKRAEEEDPFIENDPEPQEPEESKNWEIGELEIPPWLGWTILISLLIVLGVFVYRALGLFDNVSKRPAKAAERMTMDLSEVPEEELTLKETETLLQRAERTGDFTTAVRLQYLALLKELNEFGLIEYTRDKTDREYRREMDYSELGNEFSAITIDYARNWYGQYPLDRLSYRLVADRFESLRTRLQSMKKPEYA